jgi:hydroxypyruvate isomerase
MLRFDANLTTMYGKMPILDALEAARADGFKAVECRSPFEAPKQAVAEALARLNLHMVQFNTPMGDYAGGDRGIACRPGREAEFRASIAQSLDYAQALGVGQLNCCAGLMAPGETRDDLEATLCENLSYAAEQGAAVGVRLQLEAINSVDTPGMFIATVEDAERVLDRVGHDNLYLQYDFYHQQVMGGDLVQTFDRLKDRINHVQIADLPGRHEPGTGEIAYGFILRHLEKACYDGWVGLEYVPAGDAASGLGWLNAYRSGDL